MASQVNNSNTAIAVPAVASSQTQSFLFDTHNVRVVMRDGDPWFVAKDVCDVLDIQNTTQAVSKLDDDERAMFNIGRQGDGNCINESGLYSLVLTSRKPEAKRFKKWITSEVIPSIRKIGSYTAPVSSYAPQKPAEIFHDYFGIAILIGCDKNAAAIAANQATIAKTGENVLALIGHTHLLAEKQEIYLTPSELLRDINISGYSTNVFLTEAGLQEKKDGQWIPTSMGEKHCRIYDTGKKHRSGVPVQQVKWSSDVISQLQPETIAFIRQVRSAKRTNLLN